MKQRKILEVHTVLKSLGSQDTPCKLNIARNLLVTTPIIESFIKNKQDKFEELVSVDENGEPVKTNEAIEAIKAGKINEAYGLPYASYVYGEENGLSILQKFIEDEQEKDIDIKFVSLKLTKKVQVKDKDTTKIVSLEEYLESVESVISSDHLAVLLEAEILS